MYGAASLADLRGRIGYELWLLEAVYEIVDQRLVAEGVDELIYPRREVRQRKQSMESPLFASETGGRDF